ncbi:MAG: hypothetical protein ABJZ55_04935 [Fuerstiella sp.]
MTSLSQLKKGKTLRAASWLVMVGFVFQMGSVSCGCFEHNGWVLLFLDGDHDQAGTRVASHQSEGVQHGHSHSHAGDHAHNDSLGQQPPNATLRPLHQCEPSAVVEAVLTEQIELPQAFAVAQLHHGKTIASMVCSLSTASKGWNHSRRCRQWPYDDSPARLLTQSFLI